MRQNKNVLLSAIALIEILSLITIWSTVPELFFSQLTFVVAGAIIVILVSKTNISFLFNLSGFIYIFSILLLLITFILGRNVRGSIRWIDLGFFNLQTSEIVKPLLLVSYAAYLSKIREFDWKKIVAFLAISAVPVLIVLKQPDLGSALTLFVLPISLLLASGQWKKLLVLTTIFLAVAVPLESKILKPYQRQRIETFINPYSDPKGAGYNVIQASIAVGSGGLIGKGVRLGTQSHLNFLPERHTDFIFASYAEEFGLVGIIFLVAAYFVILRYCLASVVAIKSVQSSLVLVGIFSFLFFQFIVNVGMNIGIMPVTGITLPLFSYGGSSLLTYSILIGFLINQLDLIVPFEI